MTATEKIISKRMKKHPARDWWRKNGYKVWRVLLFPVWLVTLAKDKAHDRKYHTTEYSDETAAAFLDAYLPRKCEIDENGALWYCLDWHWHFSKAATPRKFRILASKFSDKILDYLLNGYEMEGFTKSKEWEYDWSYDRWLKFEKGLDKLE